MTRTGVKRELGSLFQMLQMFTAAGDKWVCHSMQCNDKGLHI